MSFAIVLAKRDTKRASGNEMRLRDIQNAKNRAPFGPFRLRTVDGSVYQVKHPDYFAIPSKGRTINVYGDGEENYIYLDCYLIASIEYGEMSHLADSN